ncbi:predicted protein [Uncinocarpus reesii 1704]|uniref:Transcription regulator Rua1 C-terminal domain-containing protein n=1 Tax=Uncinocarpus reesii (strain UAMH 1704) TaxID=336963 RepID=C4JKA1_UNCRE|nr:uncharacterized protein UREG_02058 [Uncinocarpus reesii 1704]EEP77209.1 predicted protein [Uncinocarpus reesii 1704]
MDSVPRRRNPGFDAVANGQLISSKQMPQEDLWPSTLSPIRFLPPCWGRKTGACTDDDDAVDASAATADGLDPQRGALAPGRGASQDAERPRPVYQNVYSLPIADGDAKDPTWSPQSYSVPPDALVPPTLQHPDDTDQEASVRKKPRLAEQRPQQQQQQLTLNTNVPPPFSFSPYSFSSSTPSLDFNFSAYSDAPSSCSSFTPQSTLYFASTPLSPVPSPRRHSDIARFGNRPRTTSSPRPRPQSSPYSLDVGRRRLSNGSAGSFASYAPPFAGRKPVNASAFTSPQIHGSHVFPPPLVPAGGHPAGSLFLHSAFTTPDPFGQRFMVPDPIASQRIPRTLRSDLDPDQTYFEDYSGFAEPPDLLGPLKDRPLSPPREDMVPADPTMVPHEQDLRFEHDLYTPKWVRGHGNKREGWCGICKPGRWLVLKNSAFWYDKSFTHGISAVTGQAFAAPKEIRRTEGSANIWEGLCGNCGQWVGLVTSKKKGTTWFRHAYKCHNHYKPDESLKRPRDGDERPEAYHKSEAAGSKENSRSIIP